MKKTTLKALIVLIFLLLALAAIIRFKGSSLLRLYIESGIGTCVKIPILCMAPENTPLSFELNRSYIEELIPHRFPRVKMSIPKGFAIVQERMKKSYYKKRSYQGNEPIIYIVHEEKDFFINLFPDLRKQGVTDDYEFIKRLMFARLDTLKNLTDAFFVVFKSIFTPDVGEQRGVKMIQFMAADKSGFINYSLSEPDNFFDCNLFNQTGGYFKVYIKDKGAKLDLQEVVNIISTLDEPDLH